MYICDICRKSYKHKKNLTRHTKEKHRNLEHWLCEMNGCSSSFVRRSYLTRHLILCHKRDGVSARRAALHAPRGDDHPHGYYEDISDDDSVLDVLQELIGADQMKSNAVMDAFDINAFDVQVGNIPNGDDVTAGETFGDGGVGDVLSSGDTFGDGLGSDVTVCDVLGGDVTLGDDLGGDVMGDDVLDGDDSFGDVRGGNVLGGDDLGGGDSGSDVRGGNVLGGDDLDGDDSSSGW